jgi:hypothetical protein
MRVAAIEALLAGETVKMVGVVAGMVKLTPIAEIVGKRKPNDWNIERIQQHLPL